MYTVQMYMFYDINVAITLVGCVTVCDDFWGKEKITVCAYWHVFNMYSVQKTVHKLLYCVEIIRQGEKLYLVYRSRFKVL